MPDLIGALGQIGPIGIALIILLIMWILNRQTTKLYREEIARINSDHDKELDELRAQRSRELTSLREDIASLKEEIKGLRLELNEERLARMRAEETAHRLRMGESDAH
jgi:flagellar biosynthesis/type III secretory pathway M-ring protein FliF/YscJ